MRLTHLVSRRFILFLQHVATHAPEFGERAQRKDTMARNTENKQPTHLAQRACESASDSASVPSLPKKLGA